MTREEWLQSGLIILKKKLFIPLRYTVPTDVQVSCGFPATGAFSNRRRRIGECWYPQSSNGTNHQLFISPTLDNPLEVLDTLTHEIVHTVAGSKAKHGTGFKRIAVRIGLTGPMTATVAGPKLKTILEHVAKEIGEYPHKAIVGKLRPKKPYNGPIKAECSNCGYTIRISRKWVDEVGIPDCPACQTQLEGEER